MSTSIDERVVSMKFDNKQFESGAQTTMSTLDKLKEKLKFDKVTDGFSALSKAAQNVDFGSLSYGVEEVSAKFSAFQSFVHGMFASLGNDVYNFSKRFVSSLTVDQVSAGWNKYGQMAQSVATIMAATGQSQEQVYTDLEKLNWFADETSYSLTQMTGAYSKFASAGADTEDSMKAIMGLATAASRAGIAAGDARFNSVLYNAAQAMGTGYLGMMDWRSLELANIATKEFKQEIIDAGLAMGQLYQVGDKYYTVAKGTEVTAEAIRDTLSEKWVTKDVMLQAFGHYGDFVDTVYEYATENGITAERAMKDLSEYSDELGYKAFMMSMETKTFGEAVEGTADAISTAWMKIFEDIFGNYEEAKELWSGFGEILWDAFVEPLRNVLSIFDTWKKFGGRTNMIRALSNSFETLSSVLGAVKKAFTDVFPEIKGGALAVATRKIADFTEKIKPTPETLEKITKAFSGVAAIARLVTTIIGKVIKVVGKFIGGLSGGTGTVLDIAAAIGEFVANIVNGIRESEILTKTFETLGNIAEKVGGFISSVFGGVWDVLSTGGAKASTVLEAVGGAFTSLYESIRDSEAMQKIIEALTPVFDNAKAKVDEFLTSLDIDPELPFAEKAKTLFQKIGEAIQPVTDKVKTFFGNIANKVVDRLLAFDYTSITAFFTSVWTWISGKGQKVSKWFKDFSGKIDWNAVSDFFADVVKTIGAAGSGIWKGIKELFEGIDWESFKATLGDIGDWFSDKGAKIWDWIKNIGEGLKNINWAGLAAFFATLGIGGSGIGKYKLLSQLSGLIKDYRKSKGNGGLAGFLNSIKDSLSNFSDGIKKAVNINTIIKVAVSLMLLAGAVKLISSIPKDQLQDSVLAVTMLMFELSIIMAVFSKTDFKKGLAGVGAGLMFMSAGVFILAKAVTEISKIAAENPDTLVDSVFAITVLLGMLTMFGKFVEGKDYVKLGIGFMGVASSIKMLVKVIKVFSEMITNQEPLDRAIAALGMVLLALAGFSYLADGSSLISTGIGLLGVALAVKILVGVIKGFSDMIKSGEPLDQAIWSLGEVLLALAAAVWVMSAAGPSIILAGLSLIAVALAIKILVGVIKDFSDMMAEGKNIGDAVWEIGILLLELAVSMLILSLTGPMALVAGIALIIVAAAIKILAGVIKDFADMLSENKNLGDAVTELGIILLELTVSMLLLGLVGPLAILGAVGLMVVVNVLKDVIPELAKLKELKLDGVWGPVLELIGVIALLMVSGVLALVGAPGLLLLGAALKLLVPALDKLSKIDIGSAVTAANALIGAINPLLQTGVAGYLAGPGLILLGAGLLVFGTGLELASAAMVSFNDTLETLASSEAFSDFSDKLDSVFTDILTAPGDSMQIGSDVLDDKIIEMMGGAKDTLSENSDFSNEGSAMSESVADGYSMNIEDLANAAGISVDDAMAVLGGKEGDFSAEGFNYVDLLGDGALSNESLGWDFGTVVGTAVGNLDGPATTSAFTGQGSDFVSLMGTGAADNDELMTTVQTVVGDAAMNAITDSVWAKIVNVGHRIAQGISSGINDEASAMNRDVQVFTGLVTDAFNGMFQINSPSKVFREMGHYLIEGLMLGLDDKTDNMVRTSQSSANAALTAFSDTIAPGFDELSDPTIRPVMDLTDIQNGMTSMDTMLNGYVPNIGAVASISSADVNANKNAVSSMMNDLKKLVAQKNDQEGQTFNNTFNITSTDPRQAAEEISRILQRQVDRRLSVWA